LTDNAILKKNIKKDQVIRLDDVELNLPEEILTAREYQYKLLDVWHFYNVNLYFLFNINI